MSLDKGIVMEKRSLIHLNGCQMVAVAIMTTGPDPLLHEICEISVVPLNAYFEEYSEFPFFHCQIRPTKSFDKAKEYIRDALVKGCTSDLAFEMFHEWYVKLQLKENWRLIPLCHDWPTILQFFTPFFGHLNLRQYFKVEWARDVNAIASFLNDRADFHIENQIPFPARQHLTVIAGRYNIDVDNYLRYNTLYQCELLARIYKYMLAHKETL